MELLKDPFVERTVRFSMQILNDIPFYGPIPASNPSTRGGVSHVGYLESEYKTVFYMKPLL
jgi:hypothetical protein